MSATPQDPQPQTTTPSQQQPTGTVGQPLRAGKHNNNKQ